MAISDFEKAIETNPNNARAYLSIGICYDTIEEKRKAIKCYQLFLQNADPEELSSQIESTKRRIAELSK